VNQYDLAVIGGGAAGFFGAIEAATFRPGLRVVILEKSTKLLTKVKVSGGGRCNVTHHCFEPAELAHHYPRGEKPLKVLFRKFQASDTVEWFSKRGVLLKTEDDGRMFPVTDDSQTIIDCFLREALRLQIKIELSAELDSLVFTRTHFEISCRGGQKFYAAKILVAAGGNAKSEFYSWIKQLSHTIIEPIPSLFTFNDSQNHFKDLMGVSVPLATVRIASTKFIQQAPLLITHWGLSGPAVIKLSAWAAEYLHQVNYQFTALVSWIGLTSEDDVRAELVNQKLNQPKQKVFTNPKFGLPQRLWHRLCVLAEIEEGKIWGELPQKNLNKLLEFLIRCPFMIKGKTTFKEEFVTCGGVNLKDIDLETMESRKMKNVYFAGEVLNLDGETGGFNFQAAWTTAHVAARAIAAP